MRRPFWDLVRRVLIAAWAVTLVASVGLGVLTRLAPLAGLEVVTIRGSSMEPAIPKGSLVLVATIQTDRIATGDVVTARADNDVLITHRVVEIVDTRAAPSFRTQGDGNLAPDPWLLPAGSILGVVAGFVPIAGYGVAMLSTLPGLVSAITFQVALVLGIMLFDEIGAAPQTRSPSFRRQETNGTPA